MADRPIIFSGPMIRALLDGRKSQTRRVLKPQPQPDMGLVGIYAPRLTAVFGYVTPDADCKVQLRYMPGDQLWVRESIAILPRTAYALPKMQQPDDADMAAYYQADFDRSGKPRWRPSIHMPRWASRITLIVTDVRVQRVQEISASDCFSEGVQRPACLTDPAVPMLGSDVTLRDNAVNDFIRLWDSLNAERGFGWDANPWVVALTFDVIKQNIDREAA